MRPATGLRRIHRLLRPYAAGEGRSLATGAALSLAIVVLHVARPWPLKWLVDAVAGHRVPSWVPAEPWARVALLAALFLALALAGAGAAWAQLLQLNGLGNRILFRFRRGLFEHLVGQPLSFHEGRDVGELLTRVVYDTSRLRRGLNGLLVRVVQTLALFVASLVVVVWIAPALGLVLGIAGVAAFAAMRGRGRQIAGAARRQRKREGALAALVANELAQARELQFYGAAASQVLQRFGRTNDRSLRQEQKVRRLAAGLTLRVDVLVALGLALALALGAGSVTRGGLTAGDLVLFLSYALALRQPLVDFAWQTARIGRTWACAERLARIAERPRGIVDAPDAAAAPAAPSSLAFAGVWLKAPRRVRSGRKWSLRELEFEVPAACRVAVLGGNGAGKSTLLRLVPRLVDPQRGEVRLDGRDVREFAVASLRAGISAVFQDATLPALPVRSLIALGRPGASEAEVERAAGRARAHDFIMRLPQGYDTVARRGGTLFSGGERRRLALAAALLRDGHLWLLDEPTAGLDEAAAGEIAGTLLDATAGRTTLWVTHDASLVERLDWVLVLEDGRSTFAGPVDDYLEQRHRSGVLPPATPPVPL